MDDDAARSDAGSFRPIGWWARLVDQRITAAMARVLGGWSLDRLGWQVLSQAARAAPIDRATLVASLAPFATSDEVAATVDALHRRGWVAPGPTAPVPGGSVATVLTAEGRAAHRAVTAAIAAFRERMTGGVTAEEYATTVATLRRMADNLAPPTGASPR